MWIRRGESGTIWKKERSEELLIYRATFGSLKEDGIRGDHGRIPVFEINSMDSTTHTFAV